MRYGDPIRRDPSASATRIALCGRVQVEIEGREVPPPTGQTALVFSFLMARPDLSATREELIDALWPEQPPRDPLTALRPVLSRMRRALAPAELDGRERVRLAFPEPVRIDVAEATEGVEAARAAAARADWAQARRRVAPALDVLRGEFLPGFEGEWLERRRRELEELALEALEWAARAALALGGPDLAVAERHGRELIARSPFRESGHRFLIEALAASGNVAEALRAYEDVRVLLRQELGVPPAPELQALHQRLLMGEGVADPDPTGAWRGTPVSDTSIELLERDAERAGLERALEESGAAGRVVVVLGEAGIGKTALVTVAAEALAGRPVLWGVCDPLVTPRPLGAWWDVAHQTGGELLAALEGPDWREGLLRAALA